MKSVIHTCSKNFILDISYIYLIISHASANSEENGPEFVDPIPNVTVSLGRNASIPCVIKNLGAYKVMWIHIDRQMMITKHKYVVSPISRYSISVINGNRWVLHVSRVQEEDRGYYMCQINTNPIMSEVGYLQVTIPPIFIDDGSPSVVTVRENQKVTLNCRAQGFPPPKIVWKREDDRDIVLSRSIRESVIEGESIHFEKITRNDMASYLCIASNGVPPSLTRKISIRVEFSPIVLVIHQLIVSSIGSNVTLECHTEANPKAVTFWMRGTRSLAPSSKYRPTISPTNSYTTSTELKIRNVDKNDFGAYICVSKNLLGETAGTIILEEYDVTTSTRFFTPSTTALTLPHKSLSTQVMRDKSKESTSLPNKYFGSYKNNRDVFTPNIYHSNTQSNNSESESQTPSMMRILVIVAAICIF